MSLEVALRVEMSGTDKYAKRIKPNILAAHYLKSPAHTPTIRATQQTFHR